LSILQPSAKEGSVQLFAIRAVTSICRKRQKFKVRKQSSILPITRRSLFVNDQLKSILAHPCVWSTTWQNSNGKVLMYLIFDLHLDKMTT